MGLMHRVVVLLGPEDLKANRMLDDRAGERHLRCCGEFGEEFKEGQW